MAIALQDKTNVDLPSVEYPYGKIRDNTGSNNGTPVNTLVYGDIHQFFARLLVDAGVVANGLAENATNGFQYNQALLVLTGSVGTIDSVVKSANGMVKSGSTYIMQTADATYPGLVSTGTQTFSGNKTFSGLVKASSAQFTGLTVPTSGPGVEALYGTFGIINAYDRDLSVYKELRINASKLILNNEPGSGNVGIGTTSPNSVLHLVSAAQRMITLFEVGNNEHQYYGFGIGASILQYKVGATTADHVFYAGSSATTSTELMRIKGNGNVGIGISPTTTLDVAASSAAIRLTGTGTSEVNLVLRRTAGTVAEWSAYIPSGSTELRFYNGGDRVFLTADGNVGIGVSPASGYGLDISASAGAMRVTSTGTAQAILEMRRTGGTTSNWQFYLPTGSTDLRFYSGADRFTFSSAGVGTATDWIATSDRRLKDKITRIDAGEALHRVSLIASLVSRYDRIDTGKTEVGFIAQELLAVAPEYVTVPQDLKAMMAVNYSKMVVPLYKATAAIIDEVDSLKAQVKMLKLKLNDHGITV